MNSKVIDFITKERICVLSVILPDGSPHSATVHFSHEENPLRFYINTKNTTVKAKPFLKGETGKASMVIGFSEDEWLTLQMRGELRAVTSPEELEKVYKIHYAKNPDAEHYKGPETLFLEFTPRWYRYTDFNTDKEMIISSE